MKFKISHILAALCLIVLAALFAEDASAQCSMCRKIATDGTNSRTVGASLNYGILYLLSIPYILIAFFFRKQLFGFMSRLVARVKK